MSARVSEAFHQTSDPGNMDDADAARTVFEAFVERGYDATLNGRIVRVNVRILPGDVLQEASGGGTRVSRAERDYEVPALGISIKMENPSVTLDCALEFDRSIFVGLTHLPGGEREVDTQTVDHILSAAHRSAGETHSGSHTTIYDGVYRHSVRRTLIYTQDDRYDRVFLDVCDILGAAFSERPPVDLSRHAEASTQT